MIGLAVRGRCSFSRKLAGPATILPLILGWLVGCQSVHRPMKPQIEILQVPPSSIGGPVNMEDIGGRVSHARPGQQIVLYARSGVWWIQPLANQPFTKIRPDSTWKNSTHLGTEYAALLVEDGYRPAPKTATLPPEGNGVAAIAIAKGQPGAPLANTILRFSGYDWTIRAAGSDHGGEPNTYDPANAWIDRNGFLHLRMGPRNGRWTCAEVSLNRSLGYGYYAFTVQQTAHLSPSAVFGFFTWDDTRSEGFHNELDIELSRWGDPHAKNADYVVQPFYVSDNFYRFTVPPGPLTHTLQWQPNIASFTSLQDARTVGEHTFTSGIPAPAKETVHLDLYDFHHLENPAQPPGEVVIKKFEYHP